MGTLKEIVQPSLEYHTYGKYVLDDAIHALYTRLMTL